jgi:hypothetical protein
MVVEVVEDNPEVQQLPVEQEPLAMPLFMNRPLFFYYV